MTDQPFNKYEYHWRHIGTNTTGTAEFLAYSRAEMLEFINQWNTLFPGVWVYWL